MKRRFRLAEKNGEPFLLDGIRWVSSSGTSMYTSGNSLDASVYGLGILIPVMIPVNAEVTVSIDGREVCGGEKKQGTLSRLLLASGRGYSSL